MLVLTRKCQEAVAVGNTGDVAPLLKVIVLEIDGGKVRLGFEAHRDLLVHRWEIWERIQAESQGNSSRAGPVAPVG